MSLSKLPIPLTLAMHPSFSIFRKGVSFPLALLASHSVSLSLSFATIKLQGLVEQHHPDFEAVDSKLLEHPSDQPY